MEPIALPYYTSHKTVQAGKIVEIRPLQTALQGQPVVTDLVVTFPAAEVNGPDATIIRVSAEYIGKHKPQVGGYYVKYADGYESWSPADVFEGGYALVPRSHMGRVLAEFDALTDKLTKLQAFISGSVFQALSADEQELLRKQATVMDGYAAILLARLHNSGYISPKVAETEPIATEGEPSSPPTSTGEPNPHEDAPPTTPAPAEAGAVATTESEPVAAAE